MRRWPASEVSAIPSANRGIRWQRRDTSAEEVFFEFCWPAAVVQCFPIRCPPKEVRVTIKVLVGRGRAAERLRRTACELAADFLWAMRGRLCGPLVSTGPQTTDRPALPPLRWLVRLLSMMYVARFSGATFSLWRRLLFSCRVGSPRRQIQLTRPFDSVRVLHFVLFFGRPVSSCHRRSTRASLISISGDL